MDFLWRRAINVVDSSSLLLIASGSKQGDMAREKEVCEGLWEYFFRPMIPGTIPLSITRQLGTHLGYSGNATEKKETFITFSTS